MVARGSGVFQEDEFRGDMPRVQGRRRIDFKPNWLIFIWSTKRVSINKGSVRLMLGMTDYKGNSLNLIVFHPEKFSKLDQQFVKMFVLDNNFESK